jgi:hypothetical protein
MPATQISSQEFLEYQKRGLFKNTIYDTSNQVNNQTNNQTNNQNNVVKSSVRRTGGCSGCGGR